jgi:hypothetical protein
MVSEKVLVRFPVRSFVNLDIAERLQIVVLLSRDWRLLDTLAMVTRRRVFNNHEFDLW